MSIMGALGPALQAIGGVASASASSGLNWGMMEKNWGYQTKMSNSSHQREVADLRAAGLNPILSANAGASSPSGGTIPVGDMGDSLNKSVASALALKRNASELKLLDAQAANQNAQALKTSKEAAIVPDITLQKVGGDILDKAVAGAKPYASDFMEKIKSIFPQHSADSRSNLPSFTPEEYNAFIASPRYQTFEWEYGGLKKSRHSSRPYPKDFYRDSDMQLVPDNGDWWKGGK